MPVFIALYWVLMESVELRQAPFALWIKDLSVMDPYFVLPILMGASMYYMQKVEPAPPDPMQAKIMQWMPVVFTFFFVVPGGLGALLVVQQLAVDGAAISHQSQNRERCPLSHCATSFRVHPTVSRLITTR